MLDQCKFRLSIVESAKFPRLDGSDRTGFDYQIRLIWDDRIWLEGEASSPEAAGRLLGESVRGLLESFEDTAKLRRAAS